MCTDNVAFCFFFQDGAQPGREEAEEDEEEEDDDDNRDVLYEADVMQDQRILDVDDVRVFSGSKVVPGKGGRLRIVNPFAFSGVDDEGYQLQKPDKLKKKLKRIMAFELSKKDVMPDERANAVSKRMISLEKKEMINKDSYL